MKTVREILENLVGVGKDCQPRMSIDQALLALREVVVPMEGEIEKIIFQRVQYHYQDTNEDYMIGSPKTLAKAVQTELLHRLNGEE